MVTISTTAAISRSRIRRWENILFDVLLNLFGQNSTSPALTI
jgi:hypothetical protein